MDVSEDGFGDVGGSADHVFVSDKVSDVVEKVAADKD